VTTLRASQIETLGHVQEAKRLDAEELAGRIGRTPWSARKRLIRLMWAGCLAPDFDGHGCWEYETFRLTAQGRSELLGGEKR
jgi:hypothetical protein